MVAALRRGDQVVTQGGVIGKVVKVKEDGAGEVEVAFDFLSGGLLVGGAIGNAVDRVLYGAVADFLNMSCCGIRNPYAFNVADISIFIGAIGLVFFASGNAKPRDGSQKDR